MRATFISKDAIEQKAEDLLRKHGLYRVPVNPVEVARKEGFSVKNAQFKDASTSGLIHKKTGSFEIYVRDDDSVNRKRFTVAHELGHHILHLGENEELAEDSTLFRRPYLTGFETEFEGTSDKSQEVQANTFAASLLMPREFVIEKWDETDTIRDLALEFGVSQQAMAYRLANLGILPND